jgi:hypothetical protein
MTESTKSSDEDDLQAWSRSLPAVDVDDAVSQRIARRARVDIVHGPSKLRFVLPVATAIVIAGYAAWAVLKLIELLR